MALKSDRWIVEQSETNDMIRPFARDQVRQIELPSGTLRKVISFGVSSYGYDMRLGNIFRVLRQDVKGELDPKNIKPGLFQTIRADDFLVVPPHGLVLAQTLEYFKIRDRFLAIIGGETVPHKKPHPEPVLKSLEILKATAGSAVMIGDGLTDVQAGKAAGLKTCAVTYGFKPRADLVRENPDFIIDSILDLKKVIA
jgi:hypothetical protein